MKTHSPISLRTAKLLLASATLITTTQLQAASINFGSTAADMSLGTSWVGGTAPTISDIGVFNATAASSGTVGANYAIGGIVLNGNANSIGINGGSPAKNLTIGAYGIDLTNATSGKGISFNNNVNILLAADQAWVTKNSSTGVNGYVLKSDVAGTARTLTVSGAGGLSLTAKGTSTAVSSDVNIVGSGATALSLMGSAGTVSGSATIFAGKASVGNTDTMTFSKSNTSFWRVTGSISVNSTVSLNGGTLEIASGGTFKAAPVSNQNLSSASGATLIVNGAGSSFEFASDNAGQVKGVGALTATNGGTAVFGGRGNLGNQISSTASGSVTVSGDGSSVSFINSSATVNNYASGSGVVQLNNKGVLSVLGLGLRDATGGTAAVNFDGGILKFTGSQGIGLADNTTGAINSGAASAAATINVQAGGATIDTNGYANTVTQAFLHDAALDAVTPTADGGLTKTGANSLTLAGVNTYNGATNVKAGKLILASTGSINSSTSINVDSGATLDVLAQSGGAGYAIASGHTLTNNGVVDGKLAVAGTFKGTGAVTGSVDVTGALGSSGSAGVLTLQSGLTLENGSNITFGLFTNSEASDSHDGFHVTGGLLDIKSGVAATVAFGQNVNFGDAFWQNSHQWLVLQSDNTASFANSDIFSSVTTTTSGYTGEFSFTKDSGSNLVYLNYTVVPEPATWAMLVGGLGTLAFSRRFIRRRSE